MLGAYIRNAPPRAYNTTVSVLVFQTGYVGSIPTRRSKKIPQQLYFLCSHSMHCSSVGRAPDTMSGGRWFEPSYKRNLDFLAPSNNWFSSLASQAGNSGSSPDGATIKDTDRKNKQCRFESNQRKL